MSNVAVFGFSDPFSSWSHLLMAVAAFVGGIHLLRKGRGSKARMGSLAVYSCALIFLFSMSGVYHLLEPGGAARGVFQRLDHAGIWVLIAGTFTPIHVILFRGAWRWLILMIVWLIAITSLILEVIFFATIPEWLPLTLFLGLGWMGALTGYKFRTAFQGESLHHLVMGGIYYSLGGVIDFLKWPTLWAGVFAAHEVFHVFVILGAASHWAFIHRWADHPAV